MEHWLNVVALHTKSLVKNHMFLNEAWRSLKLIKHQNFHLVNFYNILYHTFRYTSKSIMYNWEVQQKPVERV